MTPVRLFCVLRPDANGKWFIQNDADHAPKGMHESVLVQNQDSIVIYFNKRYKMAGNININTDDDFAGSILASGNLGLENSKIIIRAAPHTRAEDPGIDPAKIWDYVTNKGGGNLWIGIDMWEE